MPRQQLAQLPVKNVSKSLGRVQQDLLQHFLARQQRQAAELVSGVEREDEFFHWVSWRALSAAYTLPPRSCRRAAGSAPPETSAQWTAGYGAGLADRCRPRGSPAPRRLPPRSTGTSWNAWRASRASA